MATKDPLKALTLAGEASDVEVIALDTHDLSFTGISTTIALDDGRTAPRVVWILLKRYCWWKGKVQLVSITEDVADTHQNKHGELHQQCMVNSTTLLSGDFSKLKVSLVEHKGLLSFHYWHPQAKGIYSCWQMAFSYCAQPWARETKQVHSV